MQRKLTVIPSAEAVGYSSLMECDAGGLPPTNRLI
jgi:hypothetical protein